MDAVGTMLKNRWTTIGGVLGAVAIWWQGVGAKFPESQAEWTSALMSLAIAVLGAVSKDATKKDEPAKKVLAWLILAPILLGACATGGTTLSGPPDQVAFMADTLTAVGQRGLRLNSSYVAGCHAKQIKAARCTEWRQFFEGDFKPTWLAAYDAFHVAIGTGDLATAQAKVRLAEALAEKLTVYLLTVK
jgi:hypothetical protein